MLTTLVPKGSVGSLTNDVFYSNLRLKKTELKTKEFLILSESIPHCYSVFWTHHVSRGPHFTPVPRRLLHSLLVEVDTLVDELPPLLVRPGELALQLLAPRLGVRPPSLKQVMRDQGKQIRMTSLGKTLLVCSDLTHKWSCHQCLWVSLMFFGTKECPHTDSIRTCL